MESINISFTVTGQDLVGDCPVLCASNTVSYIIAEFDLDDNWKEFDSVRAVWRTDSECISTVLDNNGNCNVPQEVLKRKNEVIVNLVGSVVEDNELTERLTTYPVVALIVDATALICGTETAEVTPSQFEQYIAQVIAEVEKVTGMTAVAVPLPEGSDPTASYEDGVLTLGIPKGEKGDTGNGIERVEFNSDYSLTFYFTESEPYTTPSIRGARGAQGYGIVSVEKIGSVGLVDTYQVNYENPEIEPTTFTVTNGAKGDTGNGIESAVLNDDYTLTLTFTDGTEYTTPSIRGEQGEPGEVTLAQFASAFPTDTASGAIASFPDGSDLFDYLSCIVNITPLQDLHGYDKPWVGGAGKQQINPTGYIESPTDTNGISTVNNGDGTFTLTGTATANAYVTLISYQLLSDYDIFTAGTAYTLSGKYNADVYVGFGVYGSGTDYWANGDSGATFSFTAEELAQKQYRLVVFVRNGTSLGNGVVIKPMICKSTEANPTTYSPYENICPITGWTGCEVDVIGFNQWDEEWELGGIGSSNGVPYPTPNSIRAKNFSSCLPNTTYYFRGMFAVYWYDNSQAFIKLDYARNNTKVSPENARYFKIGCYDSYGKIYKNDICINLSDASLNGTYKPYNPNSAVYPVSWQTEAGTVYGGTVDLVTGVLTVDRSSVNLGTLNWTKDSSGYYQTRFLDDCAHVTSSETINAICSHLAVTSLIYAGQNDGCIGVYYYANGNANYARTKGSQYETATELINALSGAYLCYELATPITYQLDPVQVACLLGQNNVWADCGSIDEVKYKADVQLWVEKKLGE